MYRLVEVGHGEQCTVIRMYDGLVKLLIVMIWRQTPFFLFSFAL